MLSERKNKSRNTIKDRKFSSHSMVSDSDKSISFKHDNYKEVDDTPLLERILQYKKPDSEIFKIDHDVDNVSILEFPFSDEEIQSNEPTQQLNEIVRNLDIEDNQFSLEFLQTLEEIDREKGLLSPPCSSCSECSSCTTNTWEQLKITDDCLKLNPTPLDEETIKRLHDLNDEHFKMANVLLSKIKHDDDFSDESENQELKLDEKKERNLTEKRKKLHSNKKKQKKITIDEKDVEYYREWKRLSSLDHIFITSPDYDYDHDTKTKHTYTENDMIPWAVKEQSRVKCTEWLNSYHD